MVKALRLTIPTQHAPAVVGKVLRCKEGFLLEKHLKAASLRPFLLGSIRPFYRSVVLVGEHSDGFERFGFIRREVGIGDDDDDITYLYPSCGGAIEANNPTAPFATDGIRFKSFTVVVVDDLHFFAFQNIGGFEQILINGNTAYVVQVGLCDFDPVYFAFKNFDEHGYVNSSWLVGPVWFLTTDINSTRPLVVAKVVRFAISPPLHLLQHADFEACAEIVFFSTTFAPLFEGLFMVYEGL